MRLLSILLTTFITTLTTLAICYAQDRPIGQQKPDGRDPMKKQDWSFGIGTFRNTVEVRGVSHLLTIDRIRERLSLTAAQRKKLNEHLSASEKRFFDGLSDVHIRGSLDQVGRLKGGTGRSLMDHLNEYRRAKNAESIQEIKQILSREQYRLLYRIYIQFLGYFSLIDDEVRSAINVSPDQSENIDLIFRDYDLKSTELKQKANERRLGPVRKAAQDPEFRKKIEKSEKGAKPEPTASSVDDLKKNEQDWAEMNRVREQAALRIERLLTKRQRSALAKLAGEPIDLGLEALTQPGSSTQPNRLLEPADEKASKPAEADGKKSP